MFKKKKKTKYDQLIAMLEFINNSHAPVPKKRLHLFGFNEQEINNLSPRSLGSGYGAVHVQHISSAPLLIDHKKKEEPSTYTLSSDGYKLLQDYWHTKASTRLTGVMIVLALVGVLLSIIMVRDFFLLIFTFLSKLV